MHCNDVELRYFSRLSGRALILCLAAYASAMLNSISRLGETRPEQEWSNETDFSGYSDFPVKRVHSKRIPKFSKSFPGNFYRSIQFRTGNLGIFGRMESAPSNSTAPRFKYPFMFPAKR